MHHQARIGLWAVQQVGGGVVGEGFALTLNVVLAGDDAPGRVVMEQLALIPTVIAVTLQAADQVIGRVIVEVFLLGGRQLRGLAIGAAYP
jgi:hypothetical protein